eukprot:267975-Prorocentrum_minimum.AAC.3
MRHHPLNNPLNNAKKLHHTATGVSSRPCSDCLPPRVYPPVPAPIGSRNGRILPSLLRLVPATG